MTKNKITKFPITERQRIRNIQGGYAVPCEVSERWLSFDRTSANLKEGEFIGIDVMTMGENYKAKKLCSLIVTKENLMHVISKIKTR
jgi:hypothetical protein